MAGEFFSPINIMSGLIASCSRCIRLVFIGTIFGAFWTFVFYVLGEDKMPKWFTHDETLQNMMLNLVPLACLSNLTMAIGMVCWSLIGAQGRYRLATLITFLSGWVSLTYLEY